MKERIYRTIPFVMVILGVFGVLITDQLWVAIMSLAGVWFLPPPIPSNDRSGAWLNVSRETSVDTVPVNVSRETITAPCAFMHGSAEAHVSGCDGWTFDQS